VVEAVVEVGVKRVVEVEGEEEEGVAIRKTQEVGVEVVHVELGHVDQAGLVVAELVQVGHEVKDLLSILPSNWKHPLLPVGKCGLII